MRSEKISKRPRVATVVKEEPDEEEEWPLEDEHIDETRPDFLESDSRHEQSWLTTDMVELVDVNGAKYYGYHMGKPEGRDRKGRIEPCHRFVLGRRCSFGDDCKYAHVVPSPNAFAERYGGYGGDGGKDGKGDSGGYGGKDGKSKYGGSTSSGSRHKW